MCSFLCMCVCVCVFGRDGVFVCETVGERESVSVFVLVYVCVCEGEYVSL